MNVKLIAKTVPELDGVATLKELVAYCARVSNPTNQANSKTSDKLLDYLLEHKHWSPFEMVHIVMEINTTRDIARQILRHRSFSFQEFSQRYAAIESQPQYREARMQDLKNRQNSTECTDQQKLAFFQQHQRRVWDQAMSAYTWALNNGIAKEQARAVMPEGLTMSRLYMAGSLRSWLHYIDIRTEEGTQLEHRQVAEECKTIIQELLE